MRTEHHLSVQEVFVNMDRTWISLLLLAECVNTV